MVKQVEADGGAQAGVAAAMGPVAAGALEKIQATVASLGKDVLVRLDIELPVEVDYAGLLVGKNEEENRLLLEKLKDQALSNWFYWVREVNEKVLLNGRVNGIRLEGVSSAGGGG